MQFEILFYVKKLYLLVSMNWQDQLLVRNWMNYWIELFQFCCFLFWFTVDFVLEWLETLYFYCLKRTFVFSVFSLLTGGGFRSWALLWWWKCTSIVRCHRVGAIKMSMLDVTTKYIYPNKYNIIIILHSLKTKPNV